MNIPRRQVLPHDVEIEILYCGICHSDLHQVRNDFGGAMYPMGAHVVVFTTSPSKIDDAKRLGADEAVLSIDAKQMGKYARNLH